VRRGFAKTKKQGEENDIMSKTCDLHGEVKNVYRILLGKPERKRPLT
jgi:hypothetical protein